MTQQQRLLLHIQELRVVDHELHAGAGSGNVYTRLSPGAVAFLTERPVAQARVTRHLHQAVVEHQAKIDTADSVSSTTITSSASAKAFKI